MHRYSGGGPPGGSAAVLVMLEKPGTAEHKAQDVGWNWNFLLFSSVFGLPLFRNGLNVWGALVLILWGLNLGVTLVVPDATGPPFSLPAPPWPHCVYSWATGAME